MGRKKKPTEEYPSPNEHELYNNLKQMPEPYRSYAAFTYLFGNRVSEALGKRVSDEKGLERWEYPPFYPSALEVAGSWLVAHEVPTLKRQGRPRRIAYVYLEGPGELRFAEILIDYLKERSPEEPAWKHSRITQWKYTDQYLGIPPHKLRGMRATKDAVTYELDAIDLQRKFNWSTPGMPMLYAAKNPHDIMRKMESRSPAAQDEE